MYSVAFVHTLFGMAMTRDSVSNVKVCNGYLFT